MRDGDAPGRFSLFFCTPHAHIYTERLECSMKIAVIPNLQKDRDGAVTREILARLKRLGAEPL